MGGREITREALPGELAAAAQSNQQVPVSIRGDRLVHHEDVVAVMDACGMAGLSNLSVGTLDR
jgi:biopolymer transport protein ExbD